MVNSLLPFPTVFVPLTPIFVDNGNKYVASCQLIVAFLSIHKDIGIFVLMRFIITFNWTFVNILFIFFKYIYSNC